MANEKIYANGLTGKIRETKFGDITSVSFKVDDFVQFLKEHESNGWVNVDLLTKKDNIGIYGVLDTWKPSGSSAGEKGNKPSTGKSKGGENDGLPF